jgi:Ca2+-binding EF-hand superfamily protein
VKKGSAGGAGAGRIALTEEQKQEVREAFDLFDADGTGESARARLCVRSAQL